jgi:TorA maturation chaperone TorD
MHLRAWGIEAVTALADGQADAPLRIAAEDDLRAQLYRLLAAALSRAPDAATLQAFAALTGDDSRLGQAIGTLARVAAASSRDTVRHEYQTLFIGLGRGELVPYGSYYLTGFLQEKPLARLRQDMARIGIKRDDTASDPEDHAASVTEIMAGLIDGAFGTPLALGDQKAFYSQHLESWLPIFFRDLETAQTSVLYSALGTVGRAFLDVETAAFEMVAS